MTNKEKFIYVLDKEIFSRGDIYAENYPDWWEDLVRYWDNFKQVNVKEKPVITEKGLKILKWMQENEKSYNNLFKSKDVGEGLFMSGRAVAGSMRKLVEEGFLEKTDDTPSIYSLTDKGSETDLSKFDKE